MDNEDNAKGGMPVRNRVIVHLSPTELEALRHLGAIEVRPPDDQLRYLLVNEAKRRGLLTDPPDPPRNERCAAIDQATGAPFCVQS